MDLWVFLTFCLILLLNVTVWFGLRRIEREQKQANDVMVMRLAAIVSLLECQGMTLDDISTGSQYQLEKLAAMAMVADQYSRDNE